MNVSGICCRVRLGCHHGLLHRLFNLVQQNVRHLQCLLQAGRYWEHKPLCLFSITNVVLKCVQIVCRHWSTWQKFLLVPETIMVVFWVHGSWLTADLFLLSWGHWHIDRSTNNHYSSIRVHGSWLAATLLSWSHFRWLCHQLLKMQIAILPSQIDFENRLVTLCTCVLICRIWMSPSGMVI